MRTNGLANQIHGHMTTPTAHRWAFALLVVLHAVGAIGTILGWGEQLLPLSGLNLLIAGLIVITLNRVHWHLWWVVAPIAGFLSEVIGVQTGWLFGSYSYGQGLGPEVAGVPLLLGLLWLMMLWGSWSLIAWLQLPAKWMRVVLAATAMTALDGLIEPVAIRAGWWSWNTTGGDVPWSNYLSWWAVAALLLAFAPTPKKESESQRQGTSLAARLLLIFTVFFILLNLFPWTP